MAIGNKSGQAGGAVPLLGESEIRQQSSAADALTITLASGVTSTAGGQGFVVRRWVAEGTSGGGVEPFAVEYDGVRGRRHIVALSSASTAITISASQSGALITVPGFTSGATITLPAMEAGLSYEFYVAGTVSSGIITISAATAGTLVVHNDAAANSIVFGKSGSASGTIIGGSVRLVSDGTKWYSIMQPAFTSAAPTSLTMTELAIVT
jgi:hypothetical protein